MRRAALTNAVELRRRGEGRTARQHWAAANSDIALLTQLTPHWFRHLLATTMVGLGDLQAAMDQGGWLDVRSVMGYSHDVPDGRRAVVAAIPAPDISPADTVLTRDVARSAEKPVGTCALNHSLEGGLRLTARGLAVVAIRPPEMREKKWCLAVKQIAAPG